MACGSADDAAGTSPAERERPARLPEPETTASNAGGQGPSAADARGAGAAPAAALLPPPAASLQAVGPYQADVGRDCDGWPRLALTTPADACVGIVTHASHPAIAAAGPRFRPRSMVQDPERDDVFWVLDAGAQRDHAGRVFRLRLPAQPGQEPLLQLVMARLNRPHGSRIGPDRKVYVGEVDGVFRFDPRAVNRALDAPALLATAPSARPLVQVAREPVVAGLATQLRREDRIRYHPMSSFVFTPTWDLVLNRGSSTDRCLESLPAARCEDEADDLAGLVLYRHLGEGRFAATGEMLARGLRNSVALVAHASGTVLQGENGVDFAEADRPHEELNVIRAGAHYGWPYCYDERGRDPSWAHSDFLCDPAQNPGYQPPLLLLPPHGAPLGMAYYDHERFAWLRGSLLIALHGYRATGHRVLVFPADARGLPTGREPSGELVGGWEASDLGPKGAPVELLVARDGAIWLVEDKNGTVLRVGSERYAAPRAPDTRATGEPTEGALDPEFAALQAAVFAPRCGSCHGFFNEPAPAAAAALRREGWLAVEGGRTALERRVSRQHERPMPPAEPLPPAELARVLAWLSAR